MATSMPRALLGMIDPRAWGGAIAGSLAGNVIPFSPGRLRPSAPHRRPENAGLPRTLGRIGSLEVRLARSAKDVKRAQRLRFKVFYEEMGAIADGATMLSRRDRDEYDPICDHLLVLDHDVPAKPFRKRKPKIVGTYRLLRQDVAERHAGFYSAGEFDVDPLIAAHPGKRFLELGRSCVLRSYRTKRTVELLWHGIWTYVLHHRVDVMIGCASLEGTDPSRLGPSLAFLHHHAGASAEWTARALPGRYVSMDRMAAASIDARSAMQALPPLVKGYLRLGAVFGDGAVVDRQFGTTDVLVILPVDRIAGRYLGHFGPSAERFAA